MADDLLSAALTYGTLIFSSNSIFALLTATGSIEKHSSRKREIALLFSFGKFAGGGAPVTQPFRIIL